jgi:hypothetical protein
MNVRAVASLAILVASLGLVGCNGGTVDAHALNRDREAIESLACEGRLLARDVAQGDTTSRFAQTHAADLSERAANLEDALSSRRTVAGIEPQVRALARKSGRVASLLEQIEKKPGDTALIRRVELRLNLAGDCP